MVIFGASNPLCCGRVLLVFRILGVMCAEVRVERVTALVGPVATLSDGRLVVVLNDDEVFRLA